MSFRGFGFWVWEGMNRNVLCPLDGSKGKSWKNSSGLLLQGPQDSTCGYLLAKRGNDLEWIM